MREVTTKGHPADLNQEAVNMLELMSRQSTRVTALSLMSGSAGCLEAVLRQPDAIFHPSRPMLVCFILTLP